MAANLSLVMDDTDKVRDLYERRARAGPRRSCRRTSTRRTTASSPSTASGSATGSAASRAPGEHAIEAIVAARAAGGPFRDLFDFCRRVDKRQVNRRVVEALIRAGAFDAIDARRAALFASVGIALGEAERAEASAAQVSLFGDAVQDAGLALVATREWTEAERLQHEKAALGFYLSGHPYASLRRRARAARPAARSRRCSRAASRR